MEKHSLVQTVKYEENIPYIKYIVDIQKKYKIRTRIIHSISS